MRRRDFIALLGGAAIVWPRPVDSQSTDGKELAIVGWLVLGSERSTRPAIEAFKSGFAALGYVDGRNMRLAYRFADGKAERLSDLTRELVSLRARVIVTASTTAIQAAHAAAPSVPIVSWASGDPIMMGWAQSLARPGGMITGLSIMGGEVVGKRLELLKQLRPQATTFVALLNSVNPGHQALRSHLGNAADRLGVKLHILEVKEPSEFADAFRRMVSLRVDGLAIIPDPVLGSNAAAISELARQHKLPTVGEARDFVDAGGLFAFSTNYPALARRAAWYVDRILKGEAPGDLPIEQPTEFKLIVNLKTAKALGLTIPPLLLARADEVIE